MLELQRMDGMSFLDIGSGSGLSSLAARRLGASVHSFDYDPDSVACTRVLRQKFFPDDPAWRVEQASVLDETYLGTLPQFDVVYSWGVLHHTGDMWRAIGNAMTRVREGGLFYIAIYNYQGPWSRRWLAIKRTYNRLPKLLKMPYGVAVMGARELRFLLPAIIRLRPASYIRSWLNYSQTSQRGMSKWHDLLDWVGGYPFEVAKPEEILRVARSQGFVLELLKTNAGGLACNEFVFRRSKSQQ
jgi:2-polyprenyl-6-hydroxyphenyl methylase/3-demethylubiquinone-9 3-methyltransferase